MDIDNKIGYVTICIPDTRFKIGYKLVDFDLDKFSQLLNARLNAFNRYLIFNDQLLPLMEDSFKYDNKTFNKYDFPSIYYLLNRSRKGPQLEKLYQIVSQKQEFLKNKVSFIQLLNKTDFIYTQYIRIDSKELKEKELQKFINYYYLYEIRLPFYVGYIFYMFYLRLHPNPDYNGIIGRLLFVENYTLLNHFPLSTFLQNVKCKYVDDIYKLFGFSQEGQTPSNSALSNSTGSSSSSKSGSSFVEPQDNQKYFSIKVDKKSVSKIILILLFSILYHQHQNDDNETKELLLEYFQDPFKENPKLENIKIKNFKKIREMINELNWIKKNKKRQK